jgi:signal transduction histidine kinase
VGRLRRSFEQMRVSLKARLEELNRLLVVSQGVASSLEMEEAVKPVLEAVHAIGGSSVRVVLVDNAVPWMDSSGEEPARYGLGQMSELYSILDDQVLQLARQQDRVLLSNLSRVRLLNSLPGHPTPNALAAIALRHENNFYGVLWMAYDQPHQFSEDEVRYLATLAGQAALAAANARLFQSAEVGRQRLAAILASTPDPVLVTDRQNRLLLSNPAAWQVLKLTNEARDGQPIQSITGESELVNLLSSSSGNRQSAEISMPDGKIYLATASTVMADGQSMGRVCLLRDITHLKELDALKSEFVSTVSHDLRSPLTLMRGYTTMLEMVGDLNEQQLGYVTKIMGAVENMSRLVNNLLDLGRIEAGIDLQLETVAVQDVVERVTSAMHLQVAQKRISMVVDIAPDSSPLIEADQALLQQAIHNLIENAIKYTGDGGSVRVSLKPAVEGLVFEVSDTGIGIAPVDQPRLFEKFFRVGQREAKKEHGTGLGLAIVKSIAERHRGRVWVESQLGKGSTFSMLLPLRQARRERQVVER